MVFQKFANQGVFYFIFGFAIELAETKSSAKFLRRDSNRVLLCLKRPICQLCQSLPFNNWNVFQKLIPNVRIKRKRRPGIIMPVRVLKDWTRPSDPCFRLIVVMVTFVGSVIWMCVWIYYGVVLSRLGIKFHEMAIVLFFVPIGANSLLLGNVKSFFFLLQSLPTLCKLYTKFTLSLTEPQVRRVQKQTHFLPCAVFVNKFF